MLMENARPDGTLQVLDNRPRGPPGGRPWGGPPAAPNPYASQGGRTPGSGMGRTPNPYADGGKTPAWNASSRTPNPHAADGGKTPAWNASSRTPNPYAVDGGKTPAWNASSRTPNPYASGGGWATPAPTSTNNNGPTATNNNGWGASSPVHNSVTAGAGGWTGPPNSGWGTGGDTWGPAVCLDKIPPMTLFDHVIADCSNTGCPGRYPGRCPRDTIPVYSGWCISTHSSGRFKIRRVVILICSHSRRRCAVCRGWRFD